MVDAELDGMSVTLYKVGVCLCLLAVVSLLTRLLP